MHPLPVRNQLAVILGGIGVLVLTTSCGELTSSTSSKSSTQPVSSSSQTVEPSISQTSNPFGECPHDIQGIRQRLVDNSKSVINHWAGNLYLNINLAEAIAIAENIAQDPRCTEVVEVAQLPQLISSSQKVLQMGQQRQERTMQTAVDLLK